MVKIKFISLVHIACIAVILLSCKSTSKDEPQTDDLKTVSDIDGNIYHTVTIGTQTWMVENLKTSKYRNGDLIGTTSPSNKNISSELTPKYQWAYNGNDSNLVVYGRLYTWYTVTDSRNVAPVGWHVATDADWTLLSEYVAENLGKSLTTAKALSDSSYWNPYSAKGAIGDSILINNSTGYSALPCGYRSASGPFYGKGNYSFWWSSTNYDETKANCKSLSYDNMTLYSTKDAKSCGFSVRCVKDSK